MRVLLMAAILASLLLVGACEDDETIVNTYLVTDSTKVLAIGEVVLRPGVDFRLNFLQLYKLPTSWLRSFRGFCSPIMLGPKHKLEQIL